VTKVVEVRVFNLILIKIAMFHAYKDDKDDDIGQNQIFIL